MITRYTELFPVYKEAIFNLWNNEYPHQLAFSDESGVDGYLNDLHKQTHYFVMGEANDIQGWACVFERENEKWFAMIIDSSIHHKGIGTKLLNELKEHEPILNGWVIDHERYTKIDKHSYLSPLSFYVKNGFRVCSDVRLEIPTLSAVKMEWKKNG